MISDGTKREREGRRERERELGGGRGSFGRQRDAQESRDTACMLRHRARLSSRLQKLIEIIGNAVDLAFGLRRGNREVGIDGGGRKGGRGHRV